MPKLSIDIEARLAKFQDGLDEVVKRTGRSAKALEGALGGVMGAVKLIGAGWIARELGAAFKGFVDLQDQFVKLSQSTGVGIEALSGYDYAAKLSGLETEELGKALVKLNEQLTKAKSNAGGQESKTLRALGIDPATLKDSEDALKAVAQRFSEFRDGSNKTAFAVALFGERIGPKLIPFLNQGADGLEALTEEARKLGLVMGSDAAKRAEEFNDNLERLSRSVGALGRDMVNGLLPALNSVIARFIDARVEGLGFGDALDVALAIKGFGTLEEKIAFVKQQLEGAKTGRTTGWFTNDIKGAEAELAKLEALRARIQSRETREFRGSFNGALLARRPGAEPIAPGTGKTGVAKQSEIDKYIESLQKQLAKTIDLNATETLYYQESLGLLGKVTNKELERAAAIARVIDENAKKNDLLKQEAELVKTIDEALSRDAKSITDQATAWRDSVDPVREVTRELERITGLVGEIGGLTEQEGALARFLLGNKLDGLHAVSEGLSEADEWAKQAAKNIQDSLGQHMFNVLDGKFTDIGKSFGNMLKRMAAEGMAANLARDLFGDFAKTGKVGGWAGDGLKWLATAFGGAKAGGGPVSSGTAYLVGEQGPELFVPNVGGKIIPNGQSGMSYSPTVNVYGEMSHSQEARLAVMMRNVAEATIANRSRRMLA